MTTTPDTGTTRRRKVHNVNGCGYRRRRRRRGEREILPTILAELREAGAWGTIKTHLMFAADLNPYVFERYLDYSRRLGLITAHTKMGRLRLTLSERGAQLLDSLDEYELCLRGAVEAARRMLKTLGVKVGGRGGGGEAQWRSPEALTRAVHMWTPTGKRVRHTQPKRSPAKRTAETGTHTG